MTLFGWAGLAGTTFVAALLQAVSGFGFAVLAVPLYLLLVDPAQAVQLAIILTTALSFAVVPRLRRTIAPALLLRLGAGSLAGLPIGLFSFRLCRPIAGPAGGRSHDPRICGDDGRVPISRGPTLGAFRQDADWRSRRRGCRGDCDRARRNGRTAGADLSVAGRDGGANRARDASRILCAVIRGNSCVPCRDCRHPWPHLGGCRHPRALRACSAALPGGRSATASAATALPFWRSRCSPSPGFIRWPPRLSGLSLANHEHLHAARQGLLNHHAEP